MNIKVLLVDDEIDFAETLGERLSARGFDVRTATSGDQAISLLKEKEADVVVLDVVMPGKSGIDTLKEIKALNALIEVIMLTGHGTLDTGIAGLKLGAYDYLLKPMETA
jgi:DNA-binding response OmpR family regulator